MKKSTMHKLKQYAQLGLFFIIALVLLKVLIFNAAEILILLLLVGLLFYLFYKS